MKNVTVALCGLFALFASCNTSHPVKSPRVPNMTDYHATPYVTEVEWDVAFGATAEMALYCETVYITIEKGEVGGVKVILKSTRD